MDIRYITRDEVRDFIDCYVEVFETLKGILPLDYVETQIQKSSTKEFYTKLLAEFDNPDCILAVSLIDEAIIGMTWGNIREDRTGWLAFMGVKKPHRGKGVGRTILNWFIDECKTRGAPSVSLDTNHTLVPAITLYESEGFVRKGLIENPYGLELILFTKDIS
jgi:GNAT superfamily N-acetyltransferase